MQRHHSYLRCEARGVVVRPAGPGREPQVLLFLGEYSDSLQVIEGDGSNERPFKLGPRLQLTVAGTGKAFDWWSDCTPCPVYDSATDAVYFAHNRGLMRLDASNTVSLVAGEATGLGCQTARGPITTSLAADGRGSLYMADRGNIVFCRLAPSGSREGEGSQAVVIRSGDIFSVDDYGFAHLACRVSDDSTGGQELIAATRNAVHRLPLTEAPGGGPPHLGDPVLLAGWDFKKLSLGTTGTEFKHVNTILLSPDGRSVLINDNGRLRQLDLATGAVTTLTSVEDGKSVKHRTGQMAWLPGSYLAVCTSDKTLQILRTPQLSQIVAPADPSRHRRTLADLLERSGSGPTCVGLRLGPKVFDVSRAVLAERSAYFRRLLAGGETEVELADTDPAAFTALLEYMFSGSLAELPPAKLRVTAELAVRWELDGAMEELEQRLLAASTSETLVSDFLWAERHHLQPLAAVLKERLLDQVTADVKSTQKATPESVVEELTARIQVLVTDMSREACSSMQQ